VAVNVPVMLAPYEIEITMEASTAEKRAQTVFIIRKPIQIQ
jgi:hypothetical protein